MTELEEVMLRKTFVGNEETIALLRKSFLPELDGDAPMHQVIDLWMTIKIDDKMPQEASYYLLARQTVIDVMDERLKSLNGEETLPLPLADLLPKAEKSPEEMFIDLVARNTIVQHVEQQLAFLDTLAGFKEETPEQTMERLRKNSNK